MLNLPLSKPALQRTFSLPQLDEVAKILAPQLRGVVLLVGDMGVGKTTLIKAICKAIGVTDEVSSPTFALVNEYRSATAHSIYHFDLYRLENEEEALDFGVDEYLESGNLCLVEWPEKISKFLPELVTVIALTDNLGERKLAFYPNTPATEIS